MKLFAFDLENTLIYNEFLTDLAALVGRGEEVRRITRLGIDGAIDWEEGFRRRTQLLAGIPRTAVVSCAANLRLVPGALGFVKALKGRDHRVGIVTGGPREVAEAAAQLFGADAFVSNEFRYAGGRFTGDVAVRVTPATKGRLALDMARDLGIPRRELVAFADGVMDRDLLRAAGVALGVNAGGKLVPWVRYEIRDFEEAYRFLLGSGLI